MSVPLTVGGVTFNYPQQFDRNWGPTLTNWSTAVTNVLAAFPSTGVLTLSPYPASTVNFANATNTGFLALTINGSNQLTFNGTPIGATAALTDGHILVGNVSNLPADVAMTGDVTISDTGVTTLGALKVANAQIATLAGIAFTKLASTTPYFWYVANSAGVLSPIGVTASKVVITDANGLPSASTVTPTELGYLSGATSSVQTQIGTLLPLSGGTLSGNISMASNKITGLAAGTASGDAVAFQQLKTFQTLYQPTLNNIFGTTSTAFVATGNAFSITPSSAAHRIKIIAFGTLEVDSSSSGEAYITLYRNGIELSSLATGFSEIASNQASGLRVPTTVIHVDSPASTSPVLYEVYIRSSNGVAVGYGRHVESMTLEEIA